MQNVTLDAAQAEQLDQLLPEKKSRAEGRHIIPDSGGPSEGENAKS